MNISKMARVDAAKAVQADYLTDEIANKIERLNGYANEFQSHYDFLWKLGQTKHLTKMNKLRDECDKTHLPSRFDKKQVVAIVVGLGLGYSAKRVLLARQTKGTQA